MSDNKEISSISYINKDFGAIYPEMLDLAKQLTNKWDPSQSNESDPGLVLIKEGAFVADHNNYNIDKNVLENFLPSATQDRSVRNITEMNGYTPRYYISANGDVTFVWNQPEDDTSTDLFSVPAFTFVISDVDETVSYTQVEDLAISGNGVRSTCRFIEGTLQTLLINDTSTITLENLDDNNRLYLPEIMVAQNGIYIKNINTEDYDSFWTRNNYLLTQPLGSRVYKIDYDSLKSLPYIEFPTDIANLIGDGLQIQYIASSGSQGNVSANSLTKILSPSTFSAIGDDVERSIENLTIYNASSITNGKDPETIDEMYQSFRKIVGTFDTLVTCKDYDNEIYTLTDVNDSPLVSNVYVTDRRTDYNKAAQIITWDIENNFKRFKILSTDKCALQFTGTIDYETLMGYNATGGHLNEMYYCDKDTDEDDPGTGTHMGLYINMSSNSNICNFVKQDYINLNDFAMLTQAMTPYDLVLYAFKAFSMSDYNYNYYWLAYDNSFKPVLPAIREEIKADIENVKCISHTWNDPSGDDVYCFKNYAPLNILITPYNKVTEVEKEEIIDHIYQALSEKFNPRNIDFGVKLDVEEIENTIVSSDTRIRRADILPIEYKTSTMNAEGEESEISSALLVELISKNILAGRLCLFDFNEDFKFDYGQINGEIFNISSNTGGTVKTELYIPLSTDNSESSGNSTVEEISISIESNGSNYKYELKTGSEQVTITQGLVYDLENSDSFTLYELNSSEKIVKTTIFKNSGETKIKIRNLLDEGNIVSTTGKTALNQGNVEITKSTPVASAGIGITNLDYTLNKNESIQIIYPNYYSSTTYSTYVNYRYEYKGSGTNTIHANTDYTLTANDKIILIYTEDGSTRTKIIYPGEVVYTSFDLIPTNDTSSNIKKTYTDEKDGVTSIDVPFKSLNSNQTISIRRLMQTMLDSTGIWCYWIVNSDSEGNNRLFERGSHTKILRSNEYFIYTNSSLNELIILGSGTKLERTDDDEERWSIPENTLTINAISDSGTSTSIPWQKNIDFAKTPFYITEMNVITLGETDNIKINGWTKELMPRISRGDNIEPIYAFNYYGYEKGNNVEDGFSICDGTITYTINGTSAILPKTNNFYEIKSRLDLNSGPGIEQQLIYTTNESSEIEESDVKSCQRILINDGENKLICPVKIQYNNFNIISDSNFIIADYIQTSQNCIYIGNTINLLTALKLFSYSLDNEKYIRTVKITSKSNDISSEGEHSKFEFFCSHLGTNNIYSDSIYMVPVHMTGNEVPVTAYFSYLEDGEEEPTILGIVDFNTDINESSESDNEIIMPGNNSYYLIPVNNTGADINNKNITLNLTWTEWAKKENESLYIDDLCVINGLNSKIKPSTITLQDVLGKINEIISNSDKPSTKPYYPYKLDNSIAMDTTDFDNAYSMWDKNNVANKMTLAQIDLKNSTIDIVNEMRSY